MPTYTYGCTVCDHTHEELLSISKRGDPVGLPCPETECGGVQKHILGAPSIVAGVNANHKRPAWYNDRLKDMKKVVGKDHTIDV